MDCIHPQEHCAAQRRSVHIVNLDPAAEDLAYEPELDVRELITVDDAMEEMELGPNGALVFCMEYLLDNSEWLEVRAWGTRRQGSSSAPCGPDY
jgi:GPN-loop GTPase